MYRLQYTSRGFSNVILG